MADTKISALTDATSASDSDELPIVQSSTTKRLTVGELFAYKRALWIPAGAMLPTISNGCTALATTEIASGQPDLTYLAFSSTATQYAMFEMAMPASWDEGTVSFKPYWHHPATTTNFGVVWKLWAMAFANDDAIGVAWTTATGQTSTDTGGTTADLYIGPESSAITVYGTPGAEELVAFRLGRIHDDGSDTMAVDAYLKGVMLYYTTAARADG